MRNSYVANGNDIIISCRYNGAYIKTIISKDDFAKADSISGRWYGYYDKKAKSIYIYGNDYKDGKGINVKLHRIITECPENKVIDHLNHDTLDNRRENLRVCDKTTNSHNMKELISSNTSGVKGVGWHKLRQKWRAYICVNNKEMHLGLYENKEDAVSARKTAEKVYFYGT